MYAIRSYYERFRLLANQYIYSVKNIIAHVSAIMIGITYANSNVTDNGHFVFARSDKVF